MNFLTLTLLALAAAAPLSAATSDEACRELTSRARPQLGDEQLFRCEAAGQTLLVTVDSEDAFVALKERLFPSGSYRDHEVKLKAVQRPADRSGKRSGATEGLKKFGPASLPMTAAVNFDNEGSRGQFLRVGPPGSTPPAADVPAQRPDSIRRSGPPGSTPPGATPPAKKGPPGSTPPGGTPPGGRSGNDAPPQGSTPPPSKPTPVFIPAAPAPNYWNTVDWGTVPMWERLPNDWEQATVDEENGRYISRWYAYSRPFVRTVGHEKVTKESHRRRGADSLSFELISRDRLEIKQCYYQGVYRLKWNSFEGEWEGRFSHYRAACKVDQQYSDTGTRADVEVRFSMRGQELMPWERETVQASFDGSRVEARVLHPSYVYAQAPGGQRGVITFEAGDKILTEPDHSGVTVELVADKASQQLKLRVFDKWAGYYQGETLEVAAKVIYVTPGWFTSNEVSDERSFTGGSQIRQASGTPPGQAGAGAVYWETMRAIGTPDKKGCRTYFLESWSFRRANNSQADNKSRISTDRIVNMGGGARISLCK